VDAVTNDSWRAVAAEASAAKAEAIDYAVNVLAGIDGALDPIETPQLRNAVAVLERARDRHAAAAKLGAVA
jgi:hypothetical protein